MHEPTLDDYRGIQFPSMLVHGVQEHVLRGKMAAENGVVVREDVMGVRFLFEVADDAFADFLDVLVIFEDDGVVHDVSGPLPLEKIAAEGFAERFHQLLRDDDSFHHALVIDDRDGILEGLLDLFKDRMHRGAGFHILERACDLDYPLSLGFGPDNLLEDHSSSPVSMKSSGNTFPTAIVFRLPVYTTPRFQYSSAAKRAFPPSYASLFSVRQDT